MRARFGFEFPWLRGCTARSEWASRSRDARRVRRSLLWLVSGVLLLLACSAEQEPARGELMVVLETDMSVPKDVTHIRIDIRLDSELKYQYDFPIAPDGTFHIPGTLAVVAGSRPAPTVGVEVIGLRTLRNGNRQARTFSKVVTTIPRSRIALLHVPVQWLCDDSALDLGDDSYASTCQPTSDGQETACIAGTCQPVAVPEPTLPTFDPKLVFGGGTGPNDPNGQCFDTVICLDAGHDVTPSTDCTLAVSGDRNQLNLGLAFAAGGDGICNDDHPTSDCYVPLAQSERFGWHFRDSGAGDGDSSTVVLPPAVCSALHAGRAKALRLSSACPTKTEQIPTCGPWSTASTPTTPAGGVTPEGDSGGAGGEAGSAGGGESGGSANMGTSGGPEMGGDSGNSAGSGGSAGNAGGSGGTAGGSGGTSATVAGFGGAAGSASPPPGCQDPLVFADSELEAFVRAGADVTVPSGPISAATAASISSVVDCSHAPASLEGIQCLANLTLIRSCAVSGISDLSPLSTLTKLTNLSVAGKSHDLSPLQGLTNLTRLSLLLDPNQVTDATPLASLTALVALYLTNGPVNGLAPLSGLKGLQNLQIEAAPSVTDISPLASLININSIAFQGQVADFSSLSVLPNLSYLAVYSDPNVDLSTITGLSHLTALDLTGDQLTSISALSGMQGIGFLILTSNQLTDLSPLNGHSNIYTLNVEGNKITNLGPLASCSGISNLNLGSNAVSDLSPLAALPLSTLKARMNLISNLSPLSALGTLGSLDLSSNQINNLSPLSSLTAITELLLDHNQIVDLSALTPLTALKNLNLSSNQVLDLSPLVANTGLATGDTLDLSYNFFDCTAQASNLTLLTNHGVTVTSLCP